MIRKNILFILLAVALVCIVIVAALVIKESWQVYTNSNLGFQIKYPKLVESLQGACDKTVEAVNTQKGLVPLKIFEDGKIIYISTEYYYDNKCNKVDNSLDLLRNGDKNFYQTWKIIFEDISNEKALDQFVKNQYGDECMVKGQEATSHKDLYDVIITGPDGVGAGAKCLINHPVALKYSPKYKKIAAWNMGQEAVFWEDISSNKYFDDEMEKSFKFLDY